MLVDRTLGTVLRNFSTLLLVALVVTLPLNLVYAVVFDDVLATSDLHGQIEGLPAGQTVRGVDAGAIQTARLAFGGVLLLEALLVPLLGRAGGGVLADEAAGRLPTTLRALAAVRRRPARPAVGVGAAGGAGVVAVGLLVWFLSWRTLALLAEALPEDLAFAGYALRWALSLSLALPFVMVPLALVRRVHRQRRVAD